VIITAGDRHMRDGGYDTDRVLPTHRPDRGDRGVRIHH
jgi:hypothetical protein